MPTPYSLRFFGGQLALLIWFKDLSYTLGEMVNAKVFANELITIFCAGIGVALIIPITAILSALHLVHESRKKRPQSLRVAVFVINLLLQIHQCEENHLYNHPHSNLFSLLM